MDESYPRTILELEDRFATEDACREYLMRLRWPAGFTCPRWGHPGGWLAKRGHVICQGCRYQGMGRIRMARIADQTRDSLHRFIRASVATGSTIHTDGNPSYAGMEAIGYHHEATVLAGRGKDAATELLPRVHRVAALLKRWLLGTHQGAARPTYLDYYLDEFTFRFNRRTSRSQGKLFYRWLQQAMQVEPAPYRSILAGTSSRPDHNIQGAVESIE